MGHYTNCVDLSVGHLIQTPGDPRKLYKLKGVLIMIIPNHEGFHQKNILTWLVDTSFCHMITYQKLFIKQKMNVKFPFKMVRNAH